MAWAVARKDRGKGPYRRGRGGFHAEGEMPAEVEHMHTDRWHGLVVLRVGNVVI